MSQRGLARALAGKDAGDREVENERRQIARYIAGENVPTPAKSRRMAAIVGGSPDAYTQSPDERRRRAAQLREIAALVDGVSRLLEEREARLEALEAEVAAEKKERRLDLEAITLRLADLEAAQETRGRSGSQRRKGGGTE